MLHHVSVGTSDVARARRFYDAVLPDIGLAAMKQEAEAVHYGSGHFTFSALLPANGDPASVGNGVHIAFDVEHRAMVDRFYQAALGHGGTSDGAPGTRPDYDANYYAAFVRDPDGNKIEVVTYSAA
jgi:catechol 2,3-dioxygenase-like lactoylglutathione lyase family enzyme